MNKETKTLLISSILRSLIICLLFTGLIIWLMIYLFSAKDGSGKPLTIGHKSIIGFGFISLILFYWILNISAIFTFLYTIDSFKQLIVLSILSLNIELFVYSIISKKKQRFSFNGLGLAMKNKFKPWKTFDILAISFLLGMYLLLAFSTSFITETPFWITLPFKSIPLFFGAYILSFSQTFILCFTSALLTLIIPGTAVYSFVQYFFDYFLMIMAIVSANLLKPLYITNKKVVNLLSFSGFIFIPIIIMFFSRTMAGITFWLNPNKNEPWYEIKWSGNNIAYSMLYNSINTVFDLGIYILTVPQICITLSFIKEKYFSNEQHLKISLNKDEVNHK